MNTLIKSKRRFVSRKCPKWFTPIWSSMPSFVRIKGAACGEKLGRKLKWKFKRKGFHCAKKKKGFCISIYSPWHRHCLSKYQVAFLLVWTCSKLIKQKKRLHNVSFFFETPSHLFANSLIESKDDKSNFRKKTLLFPVLRIISEQASSPRSVDRQAM